jgi:transcriptional regulator with XRE-family HTH domain
LTNPQETDITIIIQRCRTFVYDIMRGKSAKPNLAKLDHLAQALKVERNWLIHGMGEVHGEKPIVEHPDEIFVAIPSVAIRPSMGGMGGLIISCALGSRMS